MEDIRLRPYQEDAIKVVTETRAAAQMTALIVLPTGTGKTITFGELVRRWQEPTLILAHREELLLQARDKLHFLWPEADVGIVGGGFDELGHFITVASVQSLARPRRLEWLANHSPRLVVIDEAHHTAAASYKRIIETTQAGSQDGAFLLGVTATPDRGDKQSLMPLFGDPVYEATIPEMVLAGYLCNLRGIQVRTPVRLDGVHTRAGDFAEDELAAVVNREDRNELIVQAYMEHACPRQTIVFAVNVAHAHALEKEFDAQNIPVATVTGATPREERRRILHDYLTGRIWVVCNCAVLTEGFDAPETSCIILGRPTKSRSLYVQQVGRGTRIAPGKSDCIIVDITDNSDKHSLTIQSLPKLFGERDYKAHRNADGVKEDEDFDLTDHLTRQDDLLPAADVTIMREVHLLSDFQWQTTIGGHYFLHFPHKGTVWLKLHETGFRPGVMWADGSAQPLTDGPVQLGIAQAIAEQAATRISNGQVHLVNKRAAWRRTPASEKQRATLTRFRIAYAHDITSGEASDLISQAIARLGTKRGA